MMRFHCLQHVHFETPGNIEAWIKQKGHSISFTHFFSDAHMPSLNDFDALTIMGGPMSVHDENDFPWLKKEKEFIARAIKANKKILGICLGGQLIASVLGAKVYNNKEKEIGFMPVHFTENAYQNKLFQGFKAEEMVLHWHGETFALPEGAILLASTEACTNQAFAIGKNIIGLQFHLEVTHEIVKNMVTHAGHELVPAVFIHSGEKILKELGYLERNKTILFNLLDKFFDGSLKRQKSHLRSG
jgi:GMP synthase-like glutamine amidotransferase